VGAPLLVVQGADDELVRPRYTQKLVERLASADQAGAPRSEGLPGCTVRYLEIPGGHNIIDKDEPGWERLEQALIEFSRSIRNGERKRA
jgi:hypothetical protein